MQGMRLAKIIRKSKGLNPWAMRKLMGRSIQSYLQFEKTAQRITLRDLVTLRDISELPVLEFWALVEQVANEEKKKRGVK